MSAEPSMPTSVKAALTICKRSFIGVAVFSGVANLLMLTPAFFMLNAYDKALGHNSVSTLWVLCLLTLLMFVALWLMEGVRSWILALISTRLDRLLAPGLYERMFRNAVYAGPLRANVEPLRDLSSLRRFLTGTGMLALFDAPWLPVYLTILFLFHPLLGWMGVLAAMLFLGLAIANQVLTAPAFTESNEITGAAHSETLKNLRNAEAAAAMGMMPELFRRWRNSQERALALQESASITAGRFSASTKTLRLMVQSAALAAGVYLALSQQISPGMVIAGSLLIGRALQPVDMGVGAWRGYIDAREQIARIDELMDNIDLPIDGMELPPISGHITGIAARINVPGSHEPIVTEATFEIPAGETTLIIGSSGAGKSTLLKAILGLTPTSLGEIRLDGAECYSLDRSRVGPQIGYLPQAVELLEGSISENICRFQEIESEAVIQAAIDAGVHELILGLENGYDTLLNRGGGMLSPGQQQRIGLARALYKRPKLVVLDEPNSNLDKDGDLALARAISTLKDAKSTVIVVSHRDSLLPLADHLVIMKAGRVADFGPAADLKARLLNQGSATSETDVAAASALPKPVKKIPLPKSVVAWDSEEQA